MNEEVALTEKETIKDRIGASVEELFALAKFEGKFAPMAKLAKGFFTNFLSNTSEDTIREMLTLMQKELIPFILGEDGPDQT